MRIALRWPGDPPPPPLEWLLAGMIPMHGITSIAGQPAAGKSVIAANLCAAVGSGGAFLGRSVPAGSVLFFAAEAAHSTERRIRALADNDCSIVVGQTSGSLLDDNAVSQLLAAIDCAASRFDVPVRLVVFDALSSLTRGADENSGKEMGRAMAVLQEIVKERQLAVVLIAHTSKNGEDTRVRGHSGILADVDAHLAVKGTGSIKTIKVEKLRDGEEGEEVRFHIIEDRGALRAELVTSAQSKPKATVLRGDPAAMLQVIEQLGGRALFEDVKAGFKDAFGDRDAKNLRQALSNSRKVLAERGLIAVDGDYVVSVSNSSANVSNLSAADGEKCQQSRQLRPPFRGAADTADALPAGSSSVNSHG